MPFRTLVYVLHIRKEYLSKPRSICDVDGRLDVSRDVDWDVSVPVGCLRTKRVPEPPLWLKVLNASRRERSIDVRTAALWRIELTGLLSTKAFTSTKMCSGLNIWVADGDEVSASHSHIRFYYTLESNILWILFTFILLRDLALVIKTSFRSGPSPAHKRSQ